MEDQRFDALTTLVADGGSRRAFARLLAGGLLGGLSAVAAHAADETAAKPKQGNHTAKRPKPARRRHDHRHPAGPQAKPSHPPKPPHPPHPTPTPDPPCPEGEGQCPDGSCVPFDQCCSDQRQCADKSCLNLDQCCPEQRKCGGNCISSDLCCEDDPDPLCSPCETILCKQGTKVCHSTCQYADAICCGGQCLLPCSNGKVIDPWCQCACSNVLLTCGVGCCPEGYDCFPGAICGNWDTGDFTCPSGYSGDYRTGCIPPPA